MPTEELRAEPGRLDAVLARLTSLPRADVQRAIAAGWVRVDGAVRPKSHQLSGGELLTVDLAAAQVVPAEVGPVDIRFEDAYLIVVSKPAGLVTHPTENRRDGTLVNRLLGLGVPLSTLGGPLRPGIVHRLDAGTSGLMIVAKDDATHEALTAMLRRHAVDRRYLALVRGLVGDDAFAVEAPLGRKGARVRVQAITGKRAETAFEVRERFGRATLLECIPRAGRTHQIRVHLASIGHPVLGDRRYGGGGDDANRLELGRPFLHSWRLSFAHPVTAERLELEDALPSDLHRALEILRRGA